MEERCSTPKELKDPLAVYSSIGLPYPASLLYGGWFAATAAALSGNTSANLLGLQGKLFDMRDGRGRKTALFLKFFRREVIDSVMI